ncbi:MAG: TlpA family protein disulfide reductase [Gammaproteobacteria bacterium]|nr:MAG: TlpA family protein disulfide reductase [Gammaproteobacteria bacterium]
MRSFLIGLLLVVILFSLVLAMPSLTEVPGHPKAPDFALPDLDGKVHRLSDYRGKVVVINFWATWCPPCRKEMPSLERAWQVLRKEGIMLFAIDVAEDENAVFAFVAEHDLSFPVLLDEEGGVIGRWSAKGLPTTYVVDPEGRIVYKATGPREWDDASILEQIIALKRAP